MDHFSILKQLFVPFSSIVLFMTCIFIFTLICLQLFELGFVLFIRCPSSKKDNKDLLFTGVKYFLVCMNLMITSLLFYALIIYIEKLFYFLNLFLGCFLSNSDLFQIFKILKDALNEFKKELKT